MDRRTDQFDQQIRTRLDQMLLDAKRAAETADRENQPDRITYTTVDRDNDLKTLKQQTLQQESYKADLARQEAARKSVADAQEHQKTLVGRIFKGKAQERLVSSQAELQQANRALQAKLQNDRNYQQHIDAIKARQAQEQAQAGARRERWEVASDRLRVVQDLHSSMSGDRGARSALERLDSLKAGQQLGKSGVTNDLRDLVAQHDQEQKAQKQARADFQQKVKPGLEAANLRLAERLVAIDLKQSPVERHKQELQAMQSYRADCVDVLAKAAPRTPDADKQLAAERRALEDCKKQVEKVEKNPEAFQTKQAIRESRILGGYMGRDGAAAAGEGLELDDKRAARLNQPQQEKSKGPELAPGGRDGDLSAKTYRSQQAQEALKERTVNDYLPSDQQLDLGHGHDHGNHGHGR